MIRVNLALPCDWGFGEDSLHSRTCSESAKYVHVIHEGVHVETRAFCRYHLPMARSTYGPDYKMELPNERI